MAEIETRDESQAVQIASDALDRHMDSYDRVLDRAGISQQRAGHVLMAMRQERATLNRKAREEMRRAIAEDQEAADLGN